MPDRSLDCVVSNAEDAKPLTAVRPAGLTRFLETLPPAQAQFLRDSGFKAALNQIVLLPGESGVGGAVTGLGEDRSPFGFGHLAFALPEGSNWRLASGDFTMDDAVLGFCLGAYRFTAFKPASRSCARLVCGEAEFAGRGRKRARSGWCAT